MRWRSTHLFVLTCSVFFILLWMDHFLPQYRNSVMKKIMEDYNGGNAEEYDLKSIEMEPVRGKKNIIFLETRCAVNPNEINGTGLLLTKRQACSIESAARMNRHASVHLLYSCSMNGGIVTSLQHVKVLFKYQNVKIWKLDIPKYLAGTPLQHWDFKGLLGTSKWPVEHSSDVLRYVSLLKYGGTYLDLDVVVRKSLEELVTNYLGKESSDLLSASVLNFASDGIGREVSEMCVNEILNNFRGDVWNQNGPDLVTRVFKKLCGVEKVEEMNADRCNGLKVLPEINFNPVSYPQWGSLFSSTNVHEIMVQVNSSFGVHTWNKLSKDENINLLIMQPYGLLALHFCPEVHANSDINF